MAFTIDYISRFHHFEGTTLGERSCSFNHYIRDLTSFLKTPEDVQTFFNNLNPQNRLEEVFHLKLLLHYKQEKQLLDILYNEDSILIKLLLKDGTYVAGAFKDVAIEQFLEFLDKVSFVVRAKVITKLSKMYASFKDNILDSYYLALLQKYGLDVAKNLLSGCSLETINGELKKHKILFTNNQLTRIYERSIDFLEIYFAHLKKNNHTDYRNFARIIKMVALTNEDLYWKLLKMYEFKTTLSYKQTIIVLKKFKEEIIKDAEKYRPILNKHAIIASLTTEEFKTFYAHLLPKTIDEFNLVEFCTTYDLPVLYLFKFATKTKRFEILQDVFKSKYNSNILDHEECINELILEMVPVNDRVEIIEKKLQKDPPENNYIVYYETDKAFELLKKKISNTTEASKRINYVEWLIKVCKVNNDMNRWPEVLDYILKRHKNEDNQFYSAIFRSIQENYRLSKFDQAMWTTINGMIEAFKLRFHDADYTHQAFEEGYMRFKVKNNMSIEEDVSKIMKEAYNHHAFYRFWNERAMVRKCLDVIPIVIPKMFKGKKERQAINMYYNSVKDHNRQYKKKIDVFKHDFIVKYWEDIIADKNSDNTCIFDDLTFIRDQPELVQKIIKLIWEGNRTEDYQWKWFLKYQPQDIVLNYEKFFENKTGNRSGLRRFPYNLTYFSHLGIPELFCKKSQELLQADGLPGESHQYVAAVKLLVHHDQFIQIVEPLLPKGTTSVIDPHKDKEKNYVDVRQAISRVIGRYKRKSKSLDTLAMIAKGDYLQFALFSMHKIMYHTPEYKLKDFLDKTAAGTVSLRKHVIFILSGMSTVENVYETFKRIGQTEQNSSVRTYLLKTTINYFQLNPSKEFFDLTKQHARLLEPTNEEGYSLLIELKNISMEFISLYIEFVWEFIMESTEKDILELRYKLIGNINKTIMEHVKDNLLDKIVIKCLDFQKDDLQNVYDFVYRYIIDRDVKEVKTRITFVVEQFPKATSDLKKAKACKNTSDFIIGFCKQIIIKKNDKKVKDTLDVKQIFTEFANVCCENASFKSLTWLNITKLYIDTKDHQMFIHELCGYYTQTVNKWSLFIIHIFAEIFTEFASTITEAEKVKPQETLLDLILQFLGSGSGVHKELLVVSVLPKSVSKSDSALEKQLEIMNILNKSKFDVVTTAVSCYLDSIP